MLAAHRAGIKEIVLPRDNEKDLIDLPERVRRDLHFHPVDQVDEVLALALHNKPEPEPEAILPSVDVEDPVEVVAG